MALTPTDGKDRKPGMKRSKPVSLFDGESPRPGEEKADTPKKKSKPESLFETEDKTRSGSPAKKKKTDAHSASKAKSADSVSLKQTEERALRSNDAPKLAKKSAPKDLFYAKGDDMFGSDDERGRDSKTQKHKYGRNEGEGLSRKKPKYDRTRYNKLFGSERYTRKSVKRDREYGFFWYDWLWHILKPALCFLCAFLVLLGMVSLIWNRVYDGYIAPRDKDDVTTRIFEIQGGETVTSIGSHLEEEGYISSSSLFKYYIQFYGLTNKLQSGAYSLSKSMDLFEVADVLSSGKGSNERTIRILPGWTVEDIADYLVEIGAIGDKGDFLLLCSNAKNGDAYYYEEFVKYSLATINADENGDQRNLLANRTYPLEGYLAPDTYRIYLTADAASILRTLVKQSDVVYNSLFVKKPTAGGEGQGADEEAQMDEMTLVYGAKGVEMSADEIYILASIIEKEASTKEDMEKVSAVFYNRLASDPPMKLQSDPTAKYLTGVTSVWLTDSQKNVPSSYNTYVISGLPIGPICSPSRNALNAALHPNQEYLDENYLYFCAAEPESGKLVFAKTYQEHKENVEKYRPLWQEYDRQQALKRQQNNK